MKTDLTLCEMRVKYFILDTLCKSNIVCLVYCSASEVFFLQMFDIKEDNKAEELSLSDG